jgi:hypothetical protein
MDDDGLCHLIIYMIHAINFHILKNPQPNGFFQSHSKIYEVEMIIDDISQPHFVTKQGLMTSFFHTSCDGLVCQKCNCFFSNGARAAARRAGRRRRRRRRRRRASPAAQNENPSRVRSS